MRVIVLGSAAGGGFPQWNSNNIACRRSRAGDPHAKARTQASIAVSGDGEHWVLLNASPDIRHQIEATPELHPSHGLRSTPIAAVVLTSGEVDCVAGLLSLREQQAFTLHASARIHTALDANPIFDVLSRDLVRRHVAELDGTVALPGGLALRLFPVPGKVALYLEGASEAADGDTLGAELSHGGRSLFYLPGCAAITPALAARLHSAAAVMFDATLWQDDEMIQAGLGHKTGQRMGHISLSGAHGTLAGFRDSPVRHKILLHINNSNPILLDDSPERAEAERAGWQVAFDGMRLEL